MLNTPAKRLIQNCDGEVIGVAAESNGKEFNILAKKAVILTTGGYEYDKKALQNFVKGYPIYALGSPGNTGDGVRMASAVGAGLWHMNGASCPLGIKVPDYEGAFPLLIGTPGFIYVDKRGKRFVNEKSVELHAGLLAVDFFDNHSLDYPRIPCYLIFDETNRLKGPVTAWAGVGYTAQKYYKWSKDNSAEIDKGWIVKAETPAELAKKIGLDSASLESTLSKWNEDMKVGKGDTVFGRQMRSLPESHPAYKDFQTPLWSAPIEKAPFYAVPLYPCLLNTQGGPKRNVNAQIVDPFGQPIPRLYSSGELGSMWGLLYQGAGNIAECMIFGRIAGKHAAALKPWKK
jgi:succinate dehydrogenase/fumarate reductase flavoprotein subunit